MKTRRQQPINQVAMRGAACSEPHVEKAVVYAVRPTSLLVFVPKFHLKGSIHLTDRAGLVRLPLTAPGQDLDDAFAVSQRRHFQLDSNAGVIGLCPVYMLVNISHDCFYTFIKLYVGHQHHLLCMFASPHLNSTQITSPHLTSPHLTSPHLTSPSPHLTSPHLTSPHLNSPQLTSPRLTSLHGMALHPVPSHLAIILSHQHVRNAGCETVLIG